MVGVENSKYGNDIHKAKSLNQWFQFFCVLQFKHYLKNFDSTHKFNYFYDNNKMFLVVNIILGSQNQILLSC